MCPWKSLNFLVKKRYEPWYSFSDPAFRQKLCYHCLDWSANKKTFKFISNSHIYIFLSYSFGIETINTFIHSWWVPSKTIPDSRPKWAKCILAYTRFQTKTAQKPYPIRRHIAYIREYPPPRADAYWVFISKSDQNFVDNFFCTTEIETQENREKEAKHVHVAEESSSKIIETIID